ncbi:MULTISPECIES: pirin family protein [Halobacteriovorax]|uniref:Pirin family protein n=1 Tax=Halobacteriovorax vibrionivorans TaxID=2152716 RepID=A0ABY0IIU7_9BACT|nr:MULTISPECIES: pirin family protein [Halobacteriovorax]RZF21474.1 pirin family protein [Halobacteriovorax vibrionivorans]TGD48746.1 pirin family protein [Halobacteriovorax sp. Y22]
MSKKELAYIIDPPPKHWVGNGFHVHTMFHPGHNLYKYTTPFLMMDFAAPKKFAPTKAKRGVGEHPHRGFETVTFAFGGEVEHRDSSGGGGVIGKGDVQWMTAASGVVHEEFHSQKFSEEGGVFEMVQLWVNLPSEFKMTSPRYQGVKGETFPRIHPAQGVELKLVSGNYLGEVGPCKTYSPINLIQTDMKEASNFSLSLEDKTNLLVLVRKGSISLNGNEVNEHQLAIFHRDGQEVEVSSKVGAELLIMNAVPIDEPVFSHGPFVMSTKEEIIQAFEDYQSGKMGHLS